MASNQKFLSLNNETDGENYYFPATDNDAYKSDKEILPDELSDDQGEGHGHGKEAHKASVFGSAMNIANTIMGAGILALPNVIKQFGVIIGSSIITISCILTMISCSLLLKSKNLSKHSKYISIGKHCFGNGGLWIVKLIIIVNNIGLCIAYLQIFTKVGSNLLKGFVQECRPDSHSSALYCQPWILTIFASVIVSPFVFAKSMTKLQGASAIAVLAASIFSIVTIENYFAEVIDGTNPSDVNILPHIENIPTALASVTSVFLAFTFQFNFFPIYKTLSDPTDKRMKGTTSLGLTIVLIIYLSVANCGYLTFGKDGQEDFLDNFSKDSIGLTKFIIVNIAFLISSTLTFPLMFFGAKNETYGAIKLIRKKLDRRIVDFDATRPEDDEKVIEEKYGFKGFVYNSYILLLFAMIIVLAIKVPKINTVFEFVGSTAANGLNFILPALFYLKLSSKKGSMRTIAMIMTILGAISGVVGIVSSALTMKSD